jgi:hypothetical protein
LEKCLDTRRSFFEQGEAMATKLKLVDASAEGSPRPLQRHGMALWSRITRDYDVTDAAGIELLCLACQALDRTEACRAQIDDDGEVSAIDGKPVREHPLLKTELANRAFVSKTLERLGLNSEPAKAVGRPNRIVELCEIQDGVSVRQRLSMRSCSNCSGGRCLRFSADGSQQSAPLASRGRMRNTSRTVRQFERSMRLLASSFGIFLICTAA